MGKLPPEYQTNLGNAQPKFKRWAVLPRLDHPSTHWL